MPAWAAVAIWVCACALPWATALHAADEPTDAAAAAAVEATADAVSDDNSNKPAKSIDLFDLPLEELMAIDVTSVAGVARPWFRTPAAMYVLTNEDVRRGGHRHLVEALRMVPGVHVAQVDSRNWAVSTRGFNSLFANKQLVMIDGRTVYNQIFSGVFWDVQEVMLADLDRIEVIRGPGATLWGANAVDGVINVTTRPADETQGWYLFGGGGNEYQGFGGVRYGGKIDDDTYFRVWSQYENNSSFERPDGSDRPDDWDLYHVGFRLDRYADLDTTITLQSDYYGSRRLGEGYKRPEPGQHLVYTEAVGDGRVDGAYVLGRIEQQSPADNSKWTLQSYWSWERRETWDGVVLDRHTFDLDFRHHLELNDWNEVIWGLGYRLYAANVDSTASVGLDPDQRTTHLLTAFVQDTITIIPDTLFGMIGSKFEHNSYTGFELQPSGRIWWTPDERQTVWASVSRAVRTPSLAEDDVRLTTAYYGAGAGNTAPYVPLQVTGNRDVDSERLVALEAGYRVRPIDEVTVDVAGFFNDYNDLITAPGVGDGPFLNLSHGNTGGVELSTTWQIADNWRVTGSYSYLYQELDGRYSERDDSTGVQHMVQARSYYDITDDLELNAAVYFVDQLFGRDVPGYVRVDLGVTWRPDDRLEISVYGQNLLDPHHREFVDPFFQGSAAEVPRAAYIQASVRF